MAAYKTPPDLAKQFECILMEYVDRALKDYEQVVDSSSLTASSKHTYKTHPRYFVRWLKGDYSPSQS